MSSAAACSSSRMRAGLAKKCRDTTHSVRLLACKSALTVVVVASRVWLVSQHTWNYTQQKQSLLWCAMCVDFWVFYQYGFSYYNRTGPNLIIQLLKEIDDFLVAPTFVFPSTGYIDVILLLFVATVVDVEWVPRCLGVNPATFSVDDVAQQPDDKRQYQDSQDEGQNNRW